MYNQYAEHSKTFCVGNKVPGTNFSYFFFISFVLFHPSHLFSQPPIPAFEQFFFAFFNMLYLCTADCTLYTATPV